MTDIDAHLIARFNRAAALGRGGAHADALAAYETLVADATAPRARATPEFVTTARMRAAFCMMDVGRYADAAETLGALPLDTLGDDGRYEVHFARGNALGQLGQHREAFRVLVSAISAAEDVDIEDELRPLACWSSILEHGKRAGDREFVREKAAIALNTARLRGFATLAALAAAALDDPQ